MINWIDIIIIIFLSGAGLFGFIKKNCGKYVIIMTAAGFCMGVSVGSYEYLGVAWGDTSSTHGISLLILFILSIFAFIALRKRVKVFDNKGQLKLGSYSQFHRIISGVVLLLSAAILTAIVMALMVKLAAWILEADELSGSPEVFVNGVIGSSITREMDRLAGYPAIIAGAVITIAGILVSNGMLSKRLSNREINFGG